ncbi:MAG: PUA domain-containing protein [candidate division WOR-3 bacterium]|nr:pseudouridine synthase [Candidatus Bathyarchaeota archaeon]
MFGREFVLERIRKIADYQFGKNVGKRLFPDNVEIVFSRRTGRIKYIYLEGNLLATLNPTTGLFKLTIEGAKRVLSFMESKRLWVKVNAAAVSFVERGGDVFAKHVVDSDEEIRPGEEVIVVNCRDEVVAVGRAILSGTEMKFFKRGVAVKVRRGRSEK